MARTSWTFPMYIVVRGHEGGCSTDHDKYHPLQIDHISTADAASNTVTVSSFMTRWEVAAAHHRVAIDHTSNQASASHLAARDLRYKPSLITGNYNKDTKKADKSVSIFSKSGKKDLWTTDQPKGSISYKAEVHCENCWSRGELAISVDTGSQLGNSILEQTVAVIKAAAEVFSDIANGKRATSAVAATQPQCSLQAICARGGRQEDHAHHAGCQERRHPGPADSRHRAALAAKAAGGRSDHGRRVHPLRAAIFPPCAPNQRLQPLEGGEEAAVAGVEPGLEGVSRVGGGRQVAAGQGALATPQDGPKLISLRRRTA
jgi:hypothetical protein